jgi:hypothetical protein
MWRMDRVAIPALYLVRNRALNWLSSHVLRVFGGSAAVAFLSLWGTKYSFVLTGLKHLLIPLLMYWWWRRHLDTHRVILQHLHFRLGVLLRLWHICKSVLDQYEHQEIAPEL